MLYPLMKLTKFFILNILSGFVQNYLCINGLSFCLCHLRPVQSIRSMLIFYGEHELNFKGRAFSLHFALFGVIRTQQDLVNDK